jgi:PKD repeat protein
MLGDAMLFTNTTLDLGVPPAKVFTWDFGDGTPAEDHGLSDPISHVYAAMGGYTVAVTACSKPDLCNTATALVEVWALPVAGFTSNSPVNLGEVMEFTNTTLLGFPVLTTYAWDFGDGGASSVPNPTHTYADFGTFTVVLTACNDAGCSQFTADVVVSVVAPVYPSRPTRPWHLATWCYLPTQ